MGYYRKCLNEVLGMGICPIHIVIADEIDSRLQQDVDDNTFEDLCEVVYQAYIDSYSDVQLTEIVDEILINRGLF